MTDQLELAEQLFDIHQKKQELEKQEKLIKTQLLTFLDKTDTKKITTEQYIIELSHKIMYTIPTPTIFREKLGPEMAEKYIHEVVDEDARLDIPPSLIPELFPIKSDTTYLSVRVRK